MKKIISLIMFLIVVAGSFAQQLNKIPGYGQEVTRNVSDSVQTIPKGLGSLRINNNPTGSVQIRYNVADSSMYVYTGSQWLRIGSGSFGSCPTCYSSAAAINDTTLSLYRVNGDSTHIPFTIVQPDLSNYIQQGDVYLDPLWSKIDSIHVYSGGGFDSIYQFRNGDSSLRGLIYKPDGLISGGVVTWSGSGLIFNVSAAVYQINNVIYTSAAGSITLDASDVTNDRWDVIGVDTLGAIIKVTGTAAVNPGIPQVNESSQLALATYNIAANATTPTGVSELVIYNENTGTPEWPGTASGVTTNFAQTLNVFSGTKTTDAGSFVSGNSITYTKASGTVTATDYSTLKLWLRLKSNLANSATISVTLLNGTTVVTNSVPLTSYGMSKTITGAYMNISIPFNAFRFTSSAFNKVRFNLSGANASGFYMDYVVLQSGNTQVGATPNPYPVSFAKNATRDSIVMILSNGARFAAPDSVGTGGGAALTKTDDTNVTLTLGGTPTTALLNATSLTLGWTGLLSVARGGTGTATPSLVAGTNITSITGTWPNQTINAATQGTAVVKQTHTSGATITLSNTTTWLVVNPGSLLAALTVTMPASPTDGQLIDISFGGTITASGSAVVTSFTVAGNSGQGIIGATAYGTVETDDHISYRYNSTNSKWYRN